MISIHKTILVLCLLALGSNSFAQEKTKYYSIDCSSHMTPHHAMAWDNHVIRKLEQKMDRLGNHGYLEQTRIDSVKIYLNEYSNFIDKVRDADELYRFIFFIKPPVAEKQAKVDELNILVGKFKSKTKETYCVDNLRQVMDMAYTDIRALDMFLTKYSDKTKPPKGDQSKEINKEADEIMNNMRNNIMNKIVPIMENTKQNSDLIQSFIFL